MEKNGALLSGVRILDLTTVIMGPFATRILADFGADVIKIEPPEGDSSRAHPPHGAQGISGNFLNLNRNKRSVVLDLKSEAGRIAFERLLVTADVIVHNLREPVMKRLGFDYTRCKAIKPDIVYCAAYGFGAQGPYAAKPAYDDMIQAASGFAALATPVAGSPSYAPSVICDKLVGQAIANAIMAALFHRERLGVGQEIEVPMFETSIDFNLVEAFSAAAFEPRKGPPSYARLSMKERRPFRTADGYACILPYSDRNWQDFFVFVGRHDLLGDPRFLSLADRSAHFPFLYSVIHEEAPRHSTAEWIDFCDNANIPCMPVIDLADIEEDPHVKAVRLFSFAEHPHAGRYRLIRQPTNFSEAKFELRHHAPMLGEHSRSVLEEVGLSEEAIAAALSTKSER